MKYLVCSVLFLAGMLAQWAWSTYFSLFGLVPQVLLILTIALSSQEGPVVGMSFGFAWGLFLDTLGAHLFGANALAMTLAAYIVGIGKRQMDVTSPLSQVMVTALLTVACSAFLAAAGLLFEHQSFWVGWLAFLLTPVLNAAAAPFLFVVIARTIEL